MERHRCGGADLRVRASILLVMLGIAACQPAGEEGAAKTGPAAFYGDRSIRWIIPYSPGGGYDEYARLIAPYLEKYSGARVDILNMPGAGGMRGANELFNSPPDGLTIGMINGSALVVNELAQISGADYEVNEFEYLGRIVADVRVFVVSVDSGYDSFNEVLNAGSSVKVGATGLGGSTYVDAVIINEAFNGELDIIHGFDSSSMIRQAMLRGNVTGSWGSWGSALDAVDAQRHQILLQSSRERMEELQDVPTAFELAANTGNPERTMSILSTWETLHAVGRPVAAPPGTPPDRVQFLSDAFTQALQDAELVALAKKSERMLNPASAEEMQRIVAAATDMPDEMRRLFVRAVKGEL